MFTHVLPLRCRLLDAEKVNDWNAIEEIDEETIRLREEINLQYQALQQVVRLGDLLRS